MTCSETRNAGPLPDTLHRVGRLPALTCAGTLFETPAHSLIPHPSSLIPWAGAIVEEKVPWRK